MEFFWIKFLKFNFFAIVLVFKFYNLNRNFEIEIYDINSSNLNFWISSKKIFYKKMKQSKIFRFLYLNFSRGILYCSRLFLFSPNYPYFLKLSLYFQNCPNTFFSNSRYKSPDCLYISQIVLILPTLSLYLTNCPYI